MTPEVEIRLSVADHAPLMHEARQGVGLARYMPLLVCVPLLFVMIPLGWEAGTTLLHLNNLAATILSAIVSFVVFLAINRRLCAIVLRRNFVPGGNFLEPKRLSVLPDGLHIESKNYSGIVFWSAIRKIVEVPGHFLLMTDVSQGYIVPKRSFPDAAAQNTFIDAVRLFTGKQSP